MKHVQLFVLAFVIHRHLLNTANCKSAIVFYATVNFIQAYIKLLTGMYFSGAAPLIQIMLTVGTL